MCSNKIKENPQLYVEHIDRFAKNLTDWEINFISDLIDHPLFAYSSKQTDIIKRIYDSKC